MCGIAGILEPHGKCAGADEVRAMLQAIAHRGPDGEDVHIQGPIALGHRRLAVLDTGSGGVQPMSFGDGRYWTTFNGEIYNFLELKQTLKGLGHTFRTESDTEVVLAAYAQWGEGCQLRFNGMWAFAVWDVEQRVLFLSRDRFGIKPLFYYADQHRFVFASEMKAFLPLPWFPASFHLPSVAASLLSPSVLEGTSDCLLKGLRRLPAGHSLTLTPGGCLRVSRWWRTSDHLERVPRGFSKQVEGFKERFTSAVRLRMRSDIPAACTLSGGLDSGSVAFTMAKVDETEGMADRRSPGRPLAFVAAYPGTDHDESVAAKAVAERSGLDSVVIDIDPNEQISLLDDFLFQCEEIQSPHMGPWLLYREMSRRGFKVSLDGHGGDELLAGYIDQVAFARESALCPFPRPFRAVELTAILRRMQSEKALPLGWRDWLVAGRVFKRLALSRLIQQPQPIRGAAFPLLKVEPLRVLYPQGGDIKNLRMNPITGRLYEDFHMRALPTILRDFDRFSMAHGVEVRSPFLDWRVVCFCLSLPAGAVLGGGFTKRILRVAMKGSLPESVRTRARKIPYKSPLSEWWDGGLYEFVRDTVTSSTFLTAEAWDGVAVRKLVEKARPGKRFDGALMVFRFVVAHRLMELFAEARSVGLNP